MRCVVFSWTGGNEIVSVQLRPDPEPGKFEALIALRTRCFGLSETAAQEIKGSFMRYQADIEAWATSIGVRS